MSYDSGGFLTANFSVRTFGAVGNNVVDDTAAIQAAIDAAEAHVAAGTGGATVLFPPGRYRIVAGLTITSGAIQLVGSGTDVTRLIFAPGVDNAVLINWDKGSVGPLNFCGIRDMRLIYNGGMGGFTATALRIVDVAEFDLTRVDITAWTNGADSIGLETQGREGVSVQGCDITADRPLLVRRNPYVDAASAGGGNHFWFTDCVWIVTPAVAQPIVEVEDDVGISEWSFENLAWVNGTHGFYWEDSSSVAAVHTLRFRGVRTEQGVDPDAFTLYIDRTGAAIVADVEWNGGPWDLNRNGAFLRNINRASIKHVGYGSTTPGAVALDIDNVISFHHDQVGIPTAPVTINMGTLQQKMALGRNQASGALLPQTGWWAQPASESQKIISLYEASFYSRSVNMTNGQIIDLDPAGNGQGRIVSRVEIFGVGSGGTTIHAVIIDQVAGPAFVVGPTGPVTLVSGTAANVNYINNGTNARIQNLLAAGETINLVALVWLR